MTAPLVARTPFDVDAIAQQLALTARTAKLMPPSWDGAKVSHGFTGAAGETLGRVLPGRGLALSLDLKSLGITKPIPHVFEQSLAMRAIDALGGRERLAMAAASVILGMKLSALGASDALLTLPLLAGVISNYDGILNARGSGKYQDFAFLSTNYTTVTTVWFSYISTSTNGTTSNKSSMLGSGLFFPAAIPGGTACNAVNSASPISQFLRNPTGGDKKYLLTLGYASTASLSQLVLVDVLAASRGISANTNAAQVVNTPALTRYAGAASAGNLLSLEVTTALGATGSALSSSGCLYTNESGTSGRQFGASQAMAASATVGRLQVTPLLSFFLPLQGSDHGLRSVEEVRFSAAMGAGDLNLYISRPLHFMPGLGNNIYAERDSTVQIDGLTELVVGTDSELGCLHYFGLTTGTGSGVVTGFMRTCDG